MQGFVVKQREKNNLLENKDESGMSRPVMAKGRLLPNGFFLTPPPFDVHQNKSLVV